MQTCKLKGLVSGPTYCMVYTVYMLIEHTATLWSSLDNTKVTQQILHIRMLQQTKKMLVCRTANITVCPHTYSNGDHDANVVYSESVTHFLILDHLPTGDWKEHVNGTGIYKNIMRILLYSVVV